MRKHLAVGFLFKIMRCFLFSGLFVACRQETGINNINNVDFIVEDDGTIVSALAETAFGVTDTCVIGLILVGPKNDNGWSEVHFVAASRVVADLNCELITFESLNVGDSPETTLLDVAEMMVDRGADMIIASADTFEEDANVVAERFPEIAVLQISGSNRLLGNAPENLANSHSMQEASRYIAGCIAVRKAFSIKAENEQISIGYLGPLINAETLRQASSAYIGARDCARRLGVDTDSQLSFEVVWIGFWFNIPGVTLDPTAVSHEFYDRGAQVIISAIDTTEPIQVASSRHNRGDNVWAIGAHLDACNAGENACIGEQFYDWTTTYQNHIAALLDGEWKAQWELRAADWEKFTNTEAGSTPVGFDIDRLSDEERNFILLIIEDLEADTKEHPGMFPGWRGPLKLQDGALFVPDGSEANPFDVWYLSQLLEGIKGTSTN